MGFHAPGVAGWLFAASLTVGCWALLGDGSLAVRRMVGLSLHRLGLLVLAGGLLLCPLAAGRLTQIALVAPCLGCAAVLARVGLVRWDGLTTAGADPPAAPPAAAESAAPAPPRGTARTVGRATGAATRIVGRGAGVAIPRAARAAGRVAGRAHRPPDQP